MVPSWVTAVKAAPGSSQPAKAGTIRRCAVLEIGRNSVRPWTIPSTIASSALTAPRLSGGAHTSSAIVSAVRAAPPGATARYQVRLRRRRLREALGERVDQPVDEHQV